MWKEGGCQRRPNKGGRSTIRSRSGHRLTEGSGSQSGGNERNRKKKGESRLGRELPEKCSGEKPEDNAEKRPPVHPVWKSFLK